MSVAILIYLHLISLPVPRRPAAERLATIRLTSRWVLHTAIHAIQMSRTTRYVVGMFDIYSSW